MRSFDRVSGKVLEWTMRKKGIREVLVRSVMSLYEGAKARVRVDSELSERSKVKVGIHQGSVLSPYLFAVVVDVAIEGTLRLLLYADDFVLMSEIMEGLRNKFIRIIVSVLKNLTLLRCFLSFYWYFFFFCVYVFVIVEAGSLKNLVIAAIIACNEPKACSVNLLKNYIRTYHNDFNIDARPYKLKAAVRRAETRNQIKYVDVLFCHDPIIVCNVQRGRDWLSLLCGDAL